MADLRMNRREFGALAAGVVLALGSRSWALTAEDARLNEFFESVFQRNLARSPIAQSRMGLKRDRDKWDDISDAQRIESANLLRDDLAALRKFDRASLSPQSDLSWRLFEQPAEEGRSTTANRTARCWRISRISSARPAGRKRIRSNWRPGAKPRCADRLPADITGSSSTCAKRSRRRPPTMACGNCRRARCITTLCCRPIRPCR